MNRWSNTERLSQPPLWHGAISTEILGRGPGYGARKNGHYWEYDTTGKQLPFLDAVSISFYNNKATEFLEFRQGRLSFINDIDPSFKDELLTKRETYEVIGKARSYCKNMLT